MCNCPDPKLCERLGRHISGRLWKIWNNEVLTPEECAKYRDLWEKSTICPVDENFYCSKHKTKHTGRAYELSQLDNELGKKYRLLWDKKPPCKCGQKHV